MFSSMLLYERARLNFVLIDLQCISMLHMVLQCFSTFSVKQNPVQQFWLLTEPVSFRGGGLLRPEGPKFEAEGWGEVLGEGQRAPFPPARRSGDWCSAVSSSSGVWPRPQIYFGPTKSIESASSGCKCQTQFNFFTEYWRSCGTLGYHQRQNRGTPVEKRCGTVWFLCRWKFLTKSVYFS